LSDFPAEARQDFRPRRISENVGYDECFKSRELGHAPAGLLKYDHLAYAEVVAEKAHGYDTSVKLAHEIDINRTYQNK
jgi:hypothetical protein